MCVKIKSNLIEIFQPARIQFDCRVKFGYSGKIFNTSLRVDEFVAFQTKRGEGKCQFAQMVTMVRKCNALDMKLDSTTQRGIRITDIIFKDFLVWNYKMDSWINQL